MPWAVGRRTSWHASSARVGGYGRATKPDAYPSLAGPAVFLSPHPDDVALSAGGLVARLALDGHRPAMVTVFGGDMVDDVISEYARGKHRTWRLADVDAVRERRLAEDESSAAILGCTLRWLGFPDAIYRADRYADHEAIFRGAPHAEEEQLAAVIAAEVLALPEAAGEPAFFVPLAAGGHVDHRIVFAAGRRLAALGHRVLALEDCPYAMHTPGAVDARLRDVGDVVGAPRNVDVTATIERRVEASLAHTSQIPNIFRFTGDPAAALRGFAASRADGHGFVERCWPVVG